MVTKRFQFSLNTSKNCFLCLSSSENKNFLLQSILRYLKINLNRIKSISKRPASILNKTEVLVGLCSDCEAVAGSFTKHFRELEMCKMKVESSLKDVLKLFKDELITQIECDEKSIKHCKIGNELRQQVLIKSRVKINKIVPKVVVSRRLPVLTKRFKRESSPEFKEAEERENYDNQLSSVNSPNNSPLEASSVDEGGAEAIKEEVEDPCTPEDFGDWLPEDEPLLKIEDLTTAEIKPKKDIRYQCEECRKTFTSELHLRRHLRHYHSTGNPNKSMSSIEFNKKIHLIRHQNNHNTKVPFKCPHCTLRFLRRDYLRQHLLRFHKGPTNPIKTELKCPHCPRSFNMTSELEVHIRRHVTPRPFKCPECPSSYRLRKELTRHLKNGTHSKKPPETKTYFLKCTVDPECPKIFTSISELNEHEKSHEIGRTLLFQKFIQALPQKLPVQGLPTSFQCKNCDKIFSTALDLKVHSQEHQSREPGPSTEVKCDLCGRLFKSMSALRLHLRVHERNKNWDGKILPKRDQVCSICNRGNFIKVTLADHMRTHTGERLMCEICPKQFTYRSSFQAHLLTHSPSFKRFRCKICHRPFRSEESLEKHRQDKHSNPNVKPACKECGKIFANENSIREHLKQVHSDEKPHQCKICSRSFTRPSVLRKHQQRVHQM